MFTSKIVPVIYSLLVGFAVSSPFSGAAQPTSSEFALYAYGKGVSGLAVFYRDGLAYLGNVSNTTNAVAVNFTQSSSDSSAYTTSPADSSSAFNETLYLAINNTEGAEEQVHFGAADSGFTTTGFKLWGQELFYVVNRMMTTGWYAVAVDNETGVYALSWKSDQTRMGNNLAVALRTVPPEGPKF